MNRPSKTIVFLAVTVVGIGVCAFWRFNQEAWPQYGKGSVGIVSHDVFVFTKDNQNEIEWHFGASGRAVWKGKSREENEAVIFDGNSVQPFSWSALLKHPLVIRFTPVRIHAYDLKRLSGFYYTRYKQEQPNNPVQSTSLGPAADR